MKTVRFTWRYCLYYTKLLFYTVCLLLKDNIFHTYYLNGFKIMPSFFILNAIQFSHSSAGNQKFWVVEANWSIAIKKLFLH